MTSENTELHPNVGGGMWYFVLGRVPELYFEEAKTIIDTLPREFMLAPASLTGKYHPPDDRRTGGLALHSYRMAAMVPEWMRIISDTEETWPLQVAAIVHDAFKPKTIRETYWQHPLLAARHIQSHVKDIAPWRVAIICCALHEGRWTDSRIFDAEPELLVSKDLDVVRAFHQLDYFLSRYMAHHVMQPDVSARILAMVQGELARKAQDTLWPGV